MWNSQHITKPFITQASDSPAPPAGSAPALRYLLDRVNVPRDMSLHAARHLRHFLEQTARASDLIEYSGGQKASVANAQSSSGGSRERVVPIPLRHRRDQDPHAFVTAKAQPVSAAAAGDQKCVSV